MLTMTKHRFEFAIIVQKSQCFVVVLCVCWLGWCAIASMLMDPHVLAASCLPHEEEGVIAGFVHCVLLVSTLAYRGGFF